MQERALFARNEFINNPKESQTDDEFLIWCFNKEDNFWYSTDGNYSRISPEQKRLHDERRLRINEIKSKRLIDTAQDYYERVLFYGKIRQQVLDRDKNTCQNCGETKPSRFHVHHIIKRKENRIDSLDNLITVCPKCHKLLDREEYSATWSK